jgi:hypothetical protein
MRVLAIGVSRVAAENVSEKTKTPSCSDTMKLQDLKAKTSAELVSFAEEYRPWPHAFSSARPKTIRRLKGDPRTPDLIAEDSLSGFPAQRGITAGLAVPRNATRIR